MLGAMDQVSRPFQIVLVLVLGFAGVWFVALRPKADTGGGSSAPAPAPTAPAQSGTSTTPTKSAIPGGLGRAVDKARQTKATGDASAAAQDSQAAQDPTQAQQVQQQAQQAQTQAQQSQNTTATPVQTPPATPVAKPKAAAPKVGAGGANVAIVHAGTLAIGHLDTGIDKAIGSLGAVKVTVKPHRTGKAARRARPGFATPGKVRLALAKHHVVVLLFFNARASDDRAVRRELSVVNRRGGRVQVWGVSVRGLARFKNVMQGAQVLQSPTVVVLSHRTPYVFPGYTDHAEIDQAAAMALRPKA